MAALAASSPAARSAQIAPAVQPNQMLTVTLPATDWNTVLAGLQELPMRIAAQLRQQTEPNGSAPKPNGKSETPE